MSILADAIRPLWLPGIHRVTGRQERGLIGLIAQQQFQIYRPATQTAVELVFTDWDDVIEAFAFDASRMSTAAFETLDGIALSASLPKSTGWLLIRTYYGAFFASHALSRMMGRSVSQLDANTTRAIDKLTSLFGMQSLGPLQGGMYTCTADEKTKTITLSKSLAAGSHETQWNEFIGLLRIATQQVLSQYQPPPSAQRAAAKLAELEIALTDGGGLGKGSWLSVIRNRVNYHHAFGVWHPYQGRADFCDELLVKSTRWRTDPDSASIWPRPGREVQRFVESCALLVSICREVCIDMARRCPAGRSFHQFGSIGLLKLLGLPTATAIGVRVDS